MASTAADAPIKRSMSIDISIFSGKNEYFLLTGEMKSALMKFNC